MRVAISGASGLIGNALRRALEERGDRVVPLVRATGQAPDETTSGAPREARWDPATGLLEPASLEGLDALVHLAGAGIADRRWSAERKKLIFSSRIEGTRRLVASCGQLDRPPARFLCASAIGFYGSRGDEELDETSRAGSGFLANLCAAWEKEAQAAEAWARVSQLRTGLVLSARGGALAKMLPPFRLGVGGKLGSGKQYMSWISLRDQVGAILHLLDTDTTTGPVNLTAPAPVTNAAFTRALGSALGRPTVLPMPRIAVETLFGEMGKEALLGSQRVLPAVLAESGYRFRHPDLDSALQAALADRAR